MVSELVKQPELTVRSACKRYSSNVVLRGLNMTVRQGSIYGLLGPSGCGKTTLFKCIVGRQQLDSGEIFVRSRKKEDLGYMPQEICLYNEFSIRETLVYYGMMYGMSQRNITKRIQELVKLLSLPSPSRTVNQLSGGQQRRVSFSIALLHNPQLLILDEPTVGVDPIICHNIWEYLIHLTTKEQKTIVITTHYIEEARQANMIGLMREGVLLAEEHPQSLMDRHHCNSLEQVFLRLSRTQTTAKLDEHDEEPKPIFVLPRNKTKSPLEESYYPRTYRIKAQNRKTLYWIYRNFEIMLFVLSLPIVNSILFNISIGRDPAGLRVGYINEELPPGGADCRSTPLWGCHLDSPLSCRYISALENNSMVLTEFHSMEDGIDAVRRNEVWGLLHFSRNYSSSYNDRLTYLTEASDEALNQSEVSVWMDMSDQYIGNMVKRDLYFGFLEFQKELFRDCNWPVSAAEIPVNFKKAVFGSNKVIFTHYGSSAMAVLITFYMPNIFTIAALLVEKREGLLDRNMAAGLNLTELIISHISIQLVLNVIHIMSIFAINFAMFGFPMEGSWIMLSTLCFVVGVSGMCFGFMVSAVCSTDRGATVIGLGSFFSMTLTSGMVWPQEGMHYALRAVAAVLPLTQATEAYRAITARAWTIHHPVVYMGFFACFCWILIFLLVSAAMVKWLNGTGSKQ